MKFVRSIPFFSRADRVCADRPDSLASSGSAGQARNGPGLVLARIDIAKSRRPGIRAHDLREGRAGRPDPARKRIFSGDFAPGSYEFTVQPFGLPTAQATSLQLAPGTEYFLDVDWIASWTQGYPEAGLEFQPEHLWHHTGGGAGRAGVSADFALSRRAISAACNSSQRMSFRDAGNASEPAKYSPAP